MTIKELFEICENLKAIDYIMLYDSVEDFDLCTSNWKEYNKDDVKHCTAKIGKFQICKTLVAIALA